jgi:hypothetical protein
MFQTPGAALQARARFAAVTAWRPCLPQRRTIIVIMLLHTMHMPELQALSGHRDSFLQVSRSCKPPCLACGWPPSVHIMIGDGAVTLHKVTNQNLTEQVCSALFKEPLTRSPKLWHSRNIDWLHTMQARRLAASSFCYDIPVIVLAVSKLCCCMPACCSGEWSLLLRVKLADGNPMRSHCVVTVTATVHVDCEFSWFNDSGCGCPAPWAPVYTIRPGTCVARTCLSPPEVHY